jgi:hypothetical protein
MGTKTLQIVVESLVELLRIDTSLVATKVHTEQPYDHRRAVGPQHSPGRVTLRELHELENLGDRWHATILLEATDIDMLMSCTTIVGYGRASGVRDGV